MTTQLHILSTGTSIITNYEKENRNLPGFNPNDQGLLSTYLDAQPTSASAEINSLNTHTHFLENGGANISVTILHSTTEKGQRAAGVLQRFLQGKVHSIQLLPFIGFERPSSALYTAEEAARDATQSLADLKEKLTTHITNMRLRFDETHINCTGGFKAESAILYRVGLALSVPVYYMHESFRCCVNLPTD